MNEQDGLLAELDLKRGRPRVVRSLDESDLPRLMGTEPQAKPKPSGLQHIRHSHHRLAQLVAQGRPAAEISLITGYAPVYISILKGDPSFKELVAHYSEEREAVFVDVLERMTALGLSTLEELQARLADAPEKWTKRELMDMAELMIVKPMRAAGAVIGARQQGAAVSVEVNFVQAQPRPEAGVVDLEYEDLGPGAGGAR